MVLNIYHNTFEILNALSLGFTISSSTVSSVAKEPFEVELYENFEKVLQVSIPCLNIKSS